MRLRVSMDEDVGGEWANTMGGDGRGVLSDRETQGWLISEGGRLSEPASLAIGGRAGSIGSRRASRSKARSGRGWERERRAGLPDMAVTPRVTPINNAATNAAVSSAFSARGTGW